MDHCRQLAPGQVRRADEVRKYTAIKFPTECGTSISCRIFFEVSEKDAWTRYTRAQALSTCM